MQIIFASQYFPPEMGAPQARVSELARAWAAAGHSVHVLTGMPNYPTGTIPVAYRGKVMARESFGAAEVLRTWVYAAPNKGLVRRSLAYGSYAVSAASWGQWLLPRPDVVVATSPPILVALSGWAIAKTRRAAFVFDVRDLWPESIVAVGALPANNPAISAMRLMEEFLYAQAHRIVVVTESFRERLVARGVPARKICVVTNGVDVSQYVPADASASVRRELGAGGNEIVCSYVGTIGMAHGLDAVLELAGRCRTEVPRVRFAFIGDGAERARLERRARADRLDNVRFLGVQPRARMPELYAATDIALVPLRKAELFTTVLPSKIFEIMAMARPIVLSVDGEARRLLERSGGGVFAPPEDVDAMLKAVQALAGDDGQRRAMGLAGRRFVEREYDRLPLARRYASELEEAVREHRTERGKK